MHWHQLFLSLGGNLGDKAEIFENTLSLISENIGEITKLSSIYESPAWGFESDFMFWNRVLMVDTLLSPSEVLDEIGKIELLFGRQRCRGNYLSRKMDIDILFYDSLILKTDTLTIPHPLMGARRFILEPMAEIAPLFIHPETGTSVKTLLEMCSDQADVEKIAPKFLK